MIFWREEWENRTKYRKIPNFSELKQGVFRLVLDTSPAYIQSLLISKHQEFMFRKQYVWTNFKHFMAPQSDHYRS